MRELAEVQHDAWDDLLTERGLVDVYLSQGYVSASSEIDHGRPTLLYLEDRGGCVASTVIVRSVPDHEGTQDVTSPYGYGGPVGSGEAPPWEEFHRAYDRWCDRASVLTTFVRFHPLYANHADASTATTVREMSGTVAWRLAERDLFAQLHPHHRRLVRKARSAEMELRVAETPTSLEAFRELYEATMQRRGASRSYFFENSYWDALLREDLRDRVVLFEALLQGRLVAAVLCLGGPPWFHYHLGASSDEGRSLGANHFLLFEAASWAQARGCTILHLGGGVGGRPDALLGFKQRFDPDGLVPSFVGTQVHRSSLYQRLCEGRDADGFFPGYRASGVGDPSSTHPARLGAS